MIYVLSALSEEHALLVKQTRQGSQLKAVVTGVGTQNVQRVVNQLLLEKDTPDALICWGFAGALQSGLPAGSLLLPRELHTQDGQRYCLHTHWRDALQHQLAQESLIWSSAPLLHTKQIVSTPEQKQQLWRNHPQAAAVDMESAAVAAVAAEAGIPVLVLRVVIDSAERMLPGCITPGGKLSLSRLLASPSQLIPLLQLAIDYRQARTALSQAAAALIRLSHSPPPPAKDVAQIESERVAKRIKPAVCLNNTSHRSSKWMS